MKDQFGTEIPARITQCARELSIWFEMQGIQRWALMGVCSRNHEQALCELWHTIGPMNTRLFYKKGEPEG